MSKNRSPREVCSITDGMTRLDGGFMLLLHSSAAGRGSTVSLGRRLLLVGRPDRLAGLGLGERDALDLGGHPVERPLQPHVVAERLEAAALAQRGERALRIL